MHRLAALACIFLFTYCSSSTTPKESIPTTDTAVEPTRDYIAEGQEIAMTTFGVLSGKLKSALDSGGVAQAIPVCNVSAMALTDSLGEAHGVQIKRTALRFRNPKNAPTVHETTVLQEYASTIQKGGQLKPRIDTLANGSIVFHGPIMLAPLCSKCHGDVETEIGVKNYAMIQHHYPEDQAVGFKAGELRGMWSIIFE